MTSEKMTAGEIHDWIRYNIGMRQHVWLELPDDGDNDKWIEQSRKRIPYSDVNAARDIFAALAEKLHYLPGSSTWYVWNGVFHEQIAGDLLAGWLTNAFVDAHRQALGVVEDYYLSAAASLSGDAKVNKMKEFKDLKFKDHLGYKNRLSNNVGFTGLIRQIKTEFSVTDDFFVDDLRWLVFLNGVLDVKELVDNPVEPGDIAGLVSRLQDHVPDRPVWRCVDAELRDVGVSEAWSKFLNSSLPDPELRRFLATVTGAAFLGISKLKTIPVLKGKKDSGKTIYIDTIHTLAGGYGGQPDTSAINKASGGQNFEQDAFRGLRFAAVSEPDSDRKVDDSFLKKFTGGDILSTRNLHARSVQWKSQGVIFFATNRNLKYNTFDKAILDRFATVEFPNQFFDRTDLPTGVSEDFLKDRSLEDSLKADLSGILVWVMNGALTYLEDGGVYIPEPIRLNRVIQYVEGSTVVQWAQHIQSGESSTVVWDPAADPKDCMSVGDLYSDYMMWCSMDNEDPEGRKSFSNQIQDYLGVKTVKRSRYVLPSMRSKAGVF